MLSTHRAAPSDLPLHIAFGILHKHRMAGRDGLKRYDPIMIAGSDDPFGELTNVRADVEHGLHAIALEQMHQSLIGIIHRSIANDIEPR